MSPRLRIGNNLDGAMPARGKMRMVRTGERLLSSYSYWTWDLSKINPTFPLSRHVEVNEIERFFERAGKGDDKRADITDPRMTTGATMFAVLDSDPEHPDEYHIRPNVDIFTEEFGEFRSWGANTDRDETVGLIFSVYRTDDHPVSESSVYFDNSMVKVSNILWEFSPDGGDGKWYQLYDLPNRAYTRVTLPECTNRIRLRAISNNPEEWVQAIAVVPKPNYQSLDIEDLEWSDGKGELSIDGFGYMTWSVARGGNGSPIYHIFNSDDFELGRTRNAIWTVDGYGGETGYYVEAHDAAGHVITARQPGEETQEN